MELYTIFERVGQLTLCTSLLLLVLDSIYRAYLYYKLSRTSLLSKHVVITGGSSGIGKSLACEAARRGANVTIIARNQTKLSEAMHEILRSCKNPMQRVYTVTLDVSSDYGDIEKTLLDLEQEMGPVYILINCAGSAVCAKLEDTSAEDIERIHKLNVLGSIYPTKALLESMKNQGKGHIVFVASQAAMLGIYGFSVYSASKFALRGLAESLHMEVALHGIKVTISFPPDTDTPGFAEEEKNKPKETRLISQTSGLTSPDVVAKKILNDTLAGQFMSSVGFEGFMLCTLCAGMSPVVSVFNLGIQTLLMGYFRLVSAIYLNRFQRIIKRCLREKNDSKKAE